MINVKLSKREIDDLSQAIDLATKRLDEQQRAATTDGEALACEATGQRLVSVYRRIRTAAQKEAG